MMAKVAQDLSDSGYALFVFGGGKKDHKEAQDFAGIPNLEICVNKYSLREERTLMESLDLMITMDSANMHIARLSLTPVLSIWGATHPNLGFHAFGQTPDELTVQIPYEEMTCRPCSVFGAKPCERKDYACMNTLSPTLITKKVEEFYRRA
jgi:ADP-heptose:LPS heptosyltransferase